MIEALSIKILGAGMLSDVLISSFEEVKNISSIMTVEINDECDDLHWISVLVKGSSLTTLRIVLRSTPTSTASTQKTVRHKCQLKEGTTVVLSTPEDARASTVTAAEDEALEIIKARIDFDTSAEHGLDFVLENVVLETETKGADADKKLNWRTVIREDGETLSEVEQPSVCREDLDDLWKLPLGGYLVE